MRLPLSLDKIIVRPKVEPNNSGFIKSKKIFLGGSWSIFFGWKINLGGEN
jgi:hypothetical protein